MPDDDYKLGAFWFLERKGPMAGSWTFHIVNRGKSFELASAAFSIILPGGEIFPLDLSGIGPSVIYGENVQLDFFDISIPQWRDAVPVGQHTELVCEIRESPPKILRVVIEWRS